MTLSRATGIFKPAKDILAKMKEAEKLGGGEGETSNLVVMGGEDDDDDDVE